jgi:hypothetical protein
MNVPRKHREIADEVLDAVKAAFPSVRLLSMHLSPESNEDIWIDVSVPHDDLVFPVIQFASPLIIDYLVETGYKVSILPQVREPLEA